MQTPHTQCQNIGRWTAGHTQRVRVRLPSVQVFVYVYTMILSIWFNSVYRFRLTKVYGLTF